MLKTIFKQLTVAGFVTSLMAGVGYAVADNNTLPTTNSPALMNAAQNGILMNKTSLTPPTPTVIPPAPDLNAAGYVLMDVNSGTVIASKNMNNQLPPASLTKLMSLYLVSQAIKNNLIHLDDQVLISKEAWQTGGSRMFVKVGSRVPVSDLVQGVIVDSGNDATMALAQYVGGSTETFVDMMNQQARALGMNNSHFMDPTGLPQPGHYAAPYDLAILARTIWLEFPEYHSWYGEKWFTYNGIRQPNRNRLLWRYPYAVGMKTGHTDAAGYCLIGMAIKDNMTLVAVVMGAPTDEDRANDATTLLSYGFRFYNSHQLFTANTPVVTPRVWLGKKSYLPLGSQYDLYVTVPRGQFANVKFSLDLPKRIEAPIAKNQVVGNLVATLNGNTIGTYPLIALTDDAKAGFFGRLYDHIVSWFYHPKAPALNIGQAATNQAG